MPRRLDQLVEDRFGWKSTVDEFLQTRPRDILHALVNQSTDASPQQIASWQTCIQHLQESFPAIGATDPRFLSWQILLEYELPRAGGRRPDVCLLSKSRVVSIEYKDMNHVQPSGIEQCRGYVRDIREYHLESRDLSISGILLVGRLVGYATKSADCDIIAPKDLAKVLAPLMDEGMSKTAADAWVDSDFEPLPTLVEAAKSIFENEKLPQIRRATSAGIPDALELLHEIARTAKETNSHHLVLLTGTPGAGKTLVGLQFVHDYSQSQGERAVFLSRNGPLVEVLQFTLGNKTFVGDVHGFIREHGIKNTSRPAGESVLVFDEAQRAWDPAQMKRKNNVDRSEPDLFIDVADRSPYGVVLGLIGSGQEIHTGEESGVGQWADAVNKSPNDWTVHAPARVSSELPLEDLQVHTQLDLSHTLRSHAARRLHDWVDALLSSHLTHAKSLARDMQTAGFFIYATQDLRKAKDFLKQRYEDQRKATFGIVASSKSKNLVKYGLDTGFYSRTILPLNRNKAGPWYAGTNESLPDCRKFEQAVTEFSCQGLELDAVLLAWGSDLVHDGNGWQKPTYSTRNTADDPHQLRLNSYRVLLSRARDGFVVYCPAGEEMKWTFNALLSAGATDL
jgi:hypothetical protein